MPREFHERRTSVVSHSQSSLSGYTQPMYTPTMSPQSYEMSRGQIGFRTLNSPIDPSLELVFVHGLMGDSSLTWTFENDKAMFWPEWLLEEVDFSNVRIHSYGYHIHGVGDRVPVSKVKDVGVAMCSALEMNCHVRGDANNPIVFIAHSLGGLVVKAAVEWAMQNNKFSGLARRFNAILFLATPHRDADDRNLLRNILKSCNTSSSRLDPTEPEPNTAPLQEINNSFYACLHDIRIWSFYETNNDPVVDQRRATLNLGQELQIRVNADHAGVAKFQSSADPTYCEIKDVLRDLLMTIEEELHNPEELESHLRLLADYLNVSDTQDEDLDQKEQRRVPGSCDWLLERPDFKRWRDRDGPADQKQHRIYWLSGDPGCGKSYLATRVISDLRDRGCEPSYFFFKHGDSTKQSIGSLLKSIAYQMARSSASVRRSLLAMKKEGTLTAESADIRGIWKQLFVQRIFRVELERHQYWIVDALDESRGNHELFGLLQSLSEKYSIFVTSRKDQSLERETRRLDMRLTLHPIDKEDTLQDIRTYLEHNEGDLPVDESAQMQMLIKTLVDRSKGSFLWTHLILQELSNKWTDDHIEAVLNNVPEGMQPLYTRILGNIARSDNAALARAILRWVSCAIRPLSVGELVTAVRLETSHTLKKPAQAIESICQPLISVTKDRVEVVHDTVRDFLFKKDHISTFETLPDILFDRYTSHEQIAITCLDFTIKSLRSHARKMSDSTGKVAGDDSFRDYASRNFFEHVARSASSDESDSTYRLIDVLFEFFQGPVLFWIQRLAEERSLSTLTKAGKSLKMFVARRAKFPTHLASKLDDLHQWADDLIHLVTAFGKDLYRDPGAIHSVIPPLCPSQSKIYSELRNPGVGLEVFGLSHGPWPDQISSSSFGSDYANTLACCEKAYAVSLRSPQIVIYYTTTCQEARRIMTSETMKRLEFVSAKDWIVASGRTTLAMYNFDTGVEVWSTPTTNEIFDLSVAPDSTHIITITREKDIETFDIKTGERTDLRRLEHSKLQGRSPMQVHISHEMKLIVLIHRHEELELYDLNSLQRSKGRIAYSSNIETVALNKAYNMLAIAAFDGELCTVELSAMRKLQRTEVDASHLDVSVDGKTLIVGTKAGEIQIHDFHTLEVLYRIPYHEAEFMGLCFTTNGLRFLDIRRQVFNVWEPAALVRVRDDDETSSDNGMTAFSTAPSELIQTLLSSDASPITAIAEHHLGEHVFCAKENGTVAIYETSHGRPKQKLFDCNRTEVFFMVWNPSQNLLASADNFSTVRVHQILFTQERSIGGSTRQAWRVKEILKRPIHQPIRQVLLSVDGEFLLISTTSKEFVFRTNGGAPVLMNDFSSLSQPAMEHSKWAIFSRRKYQFLEIHQGAQMITWEKDGSRFRTESIQSPALGPPASTSDGRRNAHLVPIGIQLWAAHDDNPHTIPLIWPQSTALLADAAAAKIASYAIKEFDKIAAQVDTIIGIFRTTMIFVSIDHWICSVRIDKAKFDDPIKHRFPLPLSWRNSNRPLKALVTTKGDVCFAVEGDLVVVKNSL